MKRFLGLLSVFLIHCSPDKETPQAVPTTPQEIQKAQRDAFGFIKPQDILAGEFVYSIKTQQIFSSQQPAESLLAEESMTITEREDYLDYIEFTMVRETIDHTVPDSPKFKFKDVLYVEKPVDQSSVEDLKLNIPLQIVTSTSESPSLQDPEPVKIEYFNLKLSEESVRKPQLVLDRIPCNNIDISCFINVRKITYDIRITVPGETPQITSVELWISKEVPYLAAVLKNCFKTVLTIETARPLVRQCTTVLDYKFQ